MYIGQASAGIAGTSVRVRKSSIVEFDISINAKQPLEYRCDVSADDGARRRAPVRRKSATSAWERFWPPTHVPRLSQVPPEKHPRSRSIRGDASHRSA